MNINKLQYLRYKLTHPITQQKTEEPVFPCRAYGKKADRP